MSRKKPDPKSLFDLKVDFYESLDRATQTAISLIQAAESAIDLDQVKPGPCLDNLKKTLAAFRASLTDDGARGED